MNKEEDHTPASQLHTHTNGHGFNSGTNTEDIQSNRIVSLIRNRAWDHISPVVGEAVYRALLETQIHLNDFLPSLIDSPSYSNDFIEESPLRQLFQEIYEQIGPLWIKSPRFDFICPETEDHNINFLFQELRVYGARSSNIYIHHLDDSMDIGDDTRVPLIFEHNIIGYFSFPKQGNTYVLWVEQITMMVTSIMNTIRTLILFLQTKAQASTDVLTNIANRRAVLEKADTLIHMARRNNDIYTSLLMIDLDHFKNINDTYWHATWDRVLIEVSKALSAALRPEDALGRYGGEEFIVIINTDGEQSSVQIANRLLEAVKKIKVEVMDDTWNMPIRPTCSIWVHTILPSSNTNSNPIRLLSDKADRALYQAKEAGRQQVVHFRSENSPISVSSEWTTTGKIDINPSH